MILRICVLFFTVSLFSTGSVAAVSLADTTKLVLHNGKQHKQHTVLPKETLYSLSRKYNVPVNDIVAANPTVQTSLQIGQVVLIPVVAKANNAAVAKQAAPVAKPAAVARVYTADNAGTKWHTVAAGQTMYSIATLHALTVDDLKKINNLSSNDLQIGQKLKVGSQAPGSANKLAQYVPEKDDDLEASVASASGARPAAAGNASAAAVASPEREEAGTAKPAEPLKRVTQSGLAAVINSPFQSTKFLALHKTAPIGTMLQVKNSMNGKTVFVRVIGQLPNTGENDKVVVKISKKAYQTLEALDARFYAEVSYLQ